jgi:hypothetical protein
VREIHDRAEALRVYCKKHDGLMEAGNRLAGITALCEGRIGQELVRAQEAGEVATRGRPAKNSTASRISDLGISHDQSSDYQQLAHPDVAKNVILDVIVEAGDRCGAAQGRSTPPSATGGWIVR